MAPLVALVGLALVAGASYWGMNILSAQADETAAAGVAANQEPDDGLLAAAAAAEPSALPDELPEEVATEPPAEEEVPAPVVIQAPPGQGVDITGTILFSRGGDVWAASGTELRRVTDTKSTKTDTGPAWTSDGDEFYFIRTSQKTTGKTRLGGKYTLTPTDLMRAKADGGGRKTVYKSLIRDARGFWFSHVLQPTVSPNGRQIAVVSDGPDGSGEVVLHIVDSKTRKIRRVQAPYRPNLGHNDPDFSPDGGRIAYTYNDNRGSIAQPRIGIWTCKSKSNCAQGRNKLMRSGFANPSWSADGKWLAVEATDGTGRDIVVVSARKGDVMAKLTDDGDSFAPVVSPSGDQIAYLQRNGTNIDLRVMTLDIDERGNITLLSDQAVTTDGGVDGDSGPSWHVPRSQRVTPAAVDDSAAADAAEAPPAAASTEAPTVGETQVDEGAPAPPAA